MIHSGIIFSEPNEPLTPTGSYYMNSYDMILACYIDELSVNAGVFMQRQEKIKVFSVSSKLLFNYVRLCVAVTVRCYRPADTCRAIQNFRMVEEIPIIHRP